MKMHRILPANGNHAAAMSNKMRSSVVIKILAIVLVVILTSLGSLALIWRIGKHMGPPCWVQDTEMFMKTNHVDGVEDVVEQLIRGKPLSRRDINKLVALDFTPIKCMILGASWLDSDSKLNIYKSACDSEKRELYTALNQEEKNAIDLTEGRFVPYILHRAGGILEYVYYGYVWQDLMNRAQTLLQHGSKVQMPPHGTTTSLSNVCVVSNVQKSVTFDSWNRLDDAVAVIAVVSGNEVKTADRYDLRNDALLSIARRRDLSVDDVVALMEYVAATNCTMRVEREAALKNDVLNLLRNQKQQPEGLEDLLLDMVASGQYAPLIIDYCIQHLGALVGSIPDDLMKARIRETFVASAKDIGETYSGTALYSLAELPNRSKSEADELRRLTVAACGENANPIARISAIQLAGERGYCETLPILRSILAGIRRDAVLDMAAVGSIGLLGDADDINLLESFRARGGRRMKTAIDTAVQRINNRCSVKDAKR